MATSSLPSSGFGCLGSLGTCPAMTEGSTVHILLPRGQSVKVPKEEVGVGPKGGQRPLPCPSDQERSIWLVITSSPPCLRHWTPWWLLEEPGLLLPADLLPNSDLVHHI